MKWMIMLNQKAVAEAGLAGEDGPDVKELIILDYIRDWERSKSGRKLNRGGKLYTWINYQHLIDELPMLRIKGKSTISRMMNRLRGFGLVELEYEDQSVYVRLTDLGRRLFKREVQAENRSSSGTPVPQAAHTQVSDPQIKEKGESGIGALARADTEEGKDLVLSEAPQGVGRSSKEEKAAPVREFKPKGYSDTMFAFRKAFIAKYQVEPNIAVLKHGKLLKGLIAKYGEEAVRATLLYAVDSWDTIRLKSGVKSVVPDFNAIYFFWDQVYALHRGVEDRAREWYKGPKNADPKEALIGRWE